MNKRTLLNTLWYLVVFLLLQLVTELAAALICQTAEHTPTVSSVTTIVSSAATAALFAWRRWAPVNGRYINTRPWFTLFWVACLAIGFMMPLTFVSDELGLKMPDTYVELFKGIMHSDLGFLAIGIIAPLAEEMVFRGAILRTLHAAFGHRLRWVAIVVSALLFAVVHGNMAQGFGAFLSGLILGWMYVRTGSIVPCVMYHWVNNSASVIMFRLMPQTADMTLREFYHNSTLHLSLAIVFSLMIFGAALYQLRFRLHNDNAHA